MNTSLENDRSHSATMDSLSSSFALLRRKLVGLDIDRIRNFARSRQTTRRSVDQFSRLNEAIGLRQAESSRSIESRQRRCSTLSNLWRRRFRLALRVNSILVNVRRAATLKSEHFFFARAITCEACKVLSNERSLVAQTNNISSNLCSRNSSCDRFRVECRTKP